MVRAHEADDGLLPSRARRAFIVGALERLRRVRGESAFLRGPILEPSDRDFPDPWVPSPEGVGTLAERILAHAGLPDLGVWVVGFHGERERDAELDRTGVPRWRAHAGTAAWYAGIDELGRCRFGVDLDGLHEAEGIVGTMCHEVAHVVRDVHDLVIDDRDEEEELTDLTTVFLGFGVLTTNAAYVFRSGGLTGSSFQGTTWSHSSRGYLSVAELAYALAYQVAARGGEERSRVASLLGATQRACFEAALDDITGRPSRVPTWLPFVAVLLLPFVALGAALAHELATRPTPCVRPADCGSRSEDRCIDGECVLLCQEADDCPSGQSCVRHACR